jgi:hypothetical protein
MQTLPVGAVDNEFGSCAGQAFAIAIPSPWVAPVINARFPRKSNNVDIVVSVGFIGFLV